MARETINGISVPIPGTGEPADFVGDLRQIATDLPASIDARVPPATTTTQGKVELATSSEATTGTDTNRAVTPAGVKAALDDLLASTIYTRSQVDGLLLPHGSRIINLGDSTDDSSSGTGRWVFYYMSGSKKVAQIRNAGIGGNRTDQMLARLQSDVLDYDPDIVIFGSNTNDLGNAALVSMAQSKANIQAMVAAVRAAGVTPVLRNTLPVDGAGGNAPYDTVAARRAAVLEYNTWLRAYATSQGLDLLDVYQAAADPSTGGFAAGLTTDGIHPTEAGGKAIADYLLSLPLPASFKGGHNFARAVTDPGNMLTNGVFVGDSNADGLADSWSVAAGTATYSLTSAGAGISGNWQRVTTSGTGTASIWQILTTGYATGDVVELVGRVRTSGGGAAALVRLSPWSSASLAADAVPSVTLALDGVFSIRLTVPSDLTSLRVLVQTGGASGYIEVAEVALRNLTQLGLA